MPGLGAASELTLGRAAHLPSVLGVCQREQSKQKAVPWHQHDGSGCDRLSAVIMGEAAAYGDGDREESLVLCPICSCLLPHLALC